MGDNLDLRKELHLSMFEWDLTPLVSYIVILRDYIYSNNFYIVRFNTYYFGELKGYYVENINKQIII